MGILLSATVKTEKAVPKGSFFNYVMAWPFKA